MEKITKSKFLSTMLFGITTFIILQIIILPIVNNVDWLASITIKNASFDTGLPYSFIMLFALFFFVFSHKQKRTNNGKLILATVLSFVVPYVVGLGSNFLQYKLLAAVTSDINYDTISQQVLNKTIITEFFVCNTIMCIGYLLLLIVLSIVFIMLIKLVGITDKILFNLTKNNTIIIVVTGIAVLLVKIFNIFTIPALGISDILPWYEMFDGYYRMQGLSYNLLFATNIFVFLLIGNLCTKQNNH